MLHKPATEVRTRGLKDIHGTRFVHSTPCRDTISPGSCSIAWDSMNESCRDNTYQNSMVASDDTVRKITALEDELNRLRAQIAGFVLKQDDSDTTTSICISLSIVNKSYNLRKLAYKYVLNLLSNMHNIMLYY